MAKKKMVDVELMHQKIIETNSFVVRSVDAILSLIKGNAILLGLNKDPEAEMKFRLRVVNALFLRVYEPMKNAALDPKNNVS